MAQLIQQVPQSLERLADLRTAVSCQDVRVCVCVLGKHCSQNRSHNTDVLPLFKLLLLHRPTKSCELDDKFGVFAIYIEASLS